jgi:hypothetical protein
MSADELAFTPPPESRTLVSAIQRATAKDGDAARLMIATTGAALAGAEALAYVNVVLNGVTTKIPKLSGAPVVAGGPAYVLAIQGFMLYIGTVKTT